MVIDEVVEVSLGAVLSQDVKAVVFEEAGVVLDHVGVVKLAQNLTLADGMALVLQLHLREGNILHDILAVV